MICPSSSTPGRDLDKHEEMMLKKYAETIIVKDVKSPERLSG